MSGRHTARVRSFAPYAVYIHCHAHLVLVNSVKSVQPALEFFVLLEALYVFVSTSKVHVIFIEKQKHLHPGKQPFKAQWHPLGMSLCCCKYCLPYFWLNFTHCWGSIWITRCWKIHWGKRSVSSNSFLLFSYLLNYFWPYSYMCSQTNCKVLLLIFLQHLSLFWLLCHYWESIAVIAIGRNYTIMC